MEISRKRRVWRRKRWKEERDDGKRKGRVVNSEDRKQQGKETARIENLRERKKQGQGGARKCKGGKEKIEKRGRDATKIGVLKNVIVGLWQPGGSQRRCFYPAGTRKGKEQGQLEGQ